MGVRTVKQIVEACAERGVEALTLFAFSSENWQRPREEVSMLMNRFLEALDEEIESLHRNGLRLRFIGNLSQLSTALRERMEAAMRLTADNQGMALELADYHRLFGDWRELFRSIERLDAVTKADVRRVANETLRDTNRTVAMIETEAAPRPAANAGAGR